MAVSSWTQRELKKAGILRVTGQRCTTATQKEVTMVQDWINNYPRKIFGGLSSNLYRESLSLVA